MMTNVTLCRSTTVQYVDLAAIVIVIFLGQFCPRGKGANEVIPM